MARKQRSYRSSRSARSGSPLASLGIIGGIFVWLLAAIFAPSNPQPVPSQETGSAAPSRPHFPPPIVNAQHSYPETSRSTSGQTLPPGFGRASNPAPQDMPGADPTRVVFGQRIINVFEARCIGVTDGDTLAILTANNTQYKIRLASIDAPESKQAFGSVAKQVLSDLCFGKTLHIFQTGIDRYQRVIAFVGLNGMNINAEMIRNGLAWHYRQYSNSQELQQIEDTARAWRVGLWVDADPVSPEDFRKLR